MTRRPEASIAARLAAIAAERDVEILYAVEAGSRAWGFASPDSDFDVRFIYREPPARAFRLLPVRDVIEETGPVETPAGALPGDFVGWSLAKALRLGFASNPNLMEWVEAPIVYAEAPGFRDELRRLRAESDPRGLAHHYRGLAKATFKTYLDVAGDPVGKKYLYGVRPILAASWLCANPRPGAVPPVLFEALRREAPLHGHGLHPRRIAEEIDALLAWKTAREETRGARRFPILDAWIVAELERLETAASAIPEHRMEADLVEGILARAYPQVFGPDAPGSPGPS